MSTSTERALIVGAGRGLSASLARQCRAQGMQVALAARNVDKLRDLKAETDAWTCRCDASEPESVEELFAALGRDFGTPDLVVYNPSARARGSFVDLDVEAVRKALMVTCYGGFLVGRAAAGIMLEQGHGTILFTGASASVKGYARSASFAMGKFGLRGLVQSMARELAPQNIHVGHFVIDGAIGTNAGDADNMLEPDAIAETYLHVHRQHRSAWTWEIELRPWVETF